MSRETNTFLEVVCCVGGTKKLGEIQSSYNSVVCQLVAWFPVINLSLWGKQNLWCFDWKVTVMRRNAIKQTTLIHMKEDKAMWLGMSFCSEVKLKQVRRAHLCHFFTKTNVVQRTAAQLSKMSICH